MHNSKVSNTLKFEVEDRLVALAKKRHQITQKVDVSLELGLVSSISKTSLYGPANLPNLSAFE